MKKRLVLPFVFVLLCTVILSGCGAAKSETGSTTSSEEATASTPITIKDDRGEQTILGPAKRVIVLEWTYTEDLIALGLQPVGNADNKEYKVYISPEAALADDVTDVGNRGEPNLETIAALKPDLIINDADTNAGIYDQLSAIAPTMQFNAYRDGGYTYDRMTEIFKNIAVAVGKTDEADKVLADLDQHYTDAKSTLAKAGKSDFHYVLTQAFTSQNATSLRMFKDNSVVIGTLDKIGMINDWQTDKDEQYGFTTTTIEALAPVQDSNFIYITQKDDDVFGSAMKDNKVWNQLNFVKEKRTYALDGSTWTFGGPISSKVLVDQVVGAITK